MKKLFLYFVFFFLVFNIEGNSSEISPVKIDIKDIFNIGLMESHDKKFTLFFKTRAKSVLARGEEFNYITDYPQELFIYYKKTKKNKSLISYDWFPKKAKSLLNGYDLPVFPEDYAYYLLNDNKTIIMMSAIKSINQNFKYNIETDKLEVLSANNRYNFLVSTILKYCNFKGINSFYKCEYYKPLISTNLIN